MLQKLEEMQMKDTLRMFNGLVERCFSECVVSFRSKALTATEEKCVNTCAEKYMKHSVRHMRPAAHAPSCTCAQLHMRPLHTTHLARLARLAHLAHLAHRAHTAQTLHRAR